MEIFGWRTRFALSKGGRKFGSADRGHEGQQLAHPLRPQPDDGDATDGFCARHTIVTSCGTVSDQRWGAPETAILFLKKPSDGNRVTKGVRKMYHGTLLLLLILLVIRIQ